MALDSFDPAQAAVLEGLVRRCPEAVGLSAEDLQWPDVNVPMIYACQSHHARPNLIQAIVHAHPTALAVHGARTWESHLLPFEFVPFIDFAAATRMLVEKETLELALAVVEYALQRGFDDDGDAQAPGEARGGAIDPDNRAWFFMHVQRTVAAFLPANARLDRSVSGFEVAQTLRRTLADDNNNNNNANNRRCMVLCRALFRGHGDAPAAGNRRRIPPNVRDVLKGNKTTMACTG
jgi:hypothetical protein